MISFFEWREWESRWMGRMGSWKSLNHSLNMLFTTCGIRHAFHALGRKLIEDLDTNVVVTHLLIGVQALDNSSEAVMHLSTPPAFIKLHLLRKITKGEYLKEHQGAKGSKMGVNQRQFKSYPPKNEYTAIVSHPFQLRDGQLDLR